MNKSYETAEVIHEDFMNGKKSSHTGTTLLAVVLKSVHIHLVCQSSIIGHT